MSVISITIKIEKTNGDLALLARKARAFSFSLSFSSLLSRACISNRCTDLPDVGARRRLSYGQALYDNYFNVTLHAFPANRRHLRSFIARSEESTARLQFSRISRAIDFHGESNRSNREKT